MLFKTREKLRVFRSNNPEPILLQSAQSVIVPWDDGGSSVAFVNEADFSDVLSLHEKFDSIVALEVMFNDIEDAITLDDEIHLFRVFTLLENDILRGS